MRTGRFGPLVALDYCPACEVAPLIRRSGGLRCGSCKEEFEIDPNPKRDLVPDILAAHDDIVADAIFEKSGVQVVVQLPFPERIAPGDVLDLSFVVQNCWDTERTVAPVLSPERRSFLPQMDAAFESDPAAKMTLSGGEVGRLRLPLVVTQRAGGKYHLYWSLKVTGGGGRRIRRTERERLQDRMPPSHTFIALFAGMLMTGGGCYIELDVEKGESGSSIPRPFSTESIWKPK